METFNEDRYAGFGIGKEFLQDNISHSCLGTIRGLHFQMPPYEQGKLVMVLKGSVLDVVVDIRKQSPTYGQCFTIVLNATDHQQLWIPPGFAHGFAALEDNTLFMYKCTSVYNKDSERGIIWNDPDLSIDWKVKHALVSDKDKTLPLFNELKSPF
jgi:dTDP-4-dehydrorhamnose 3,5-epimerase